jgi:hypothetical protein
MVERQFLIDQFPFLEVLDYKAFVFQLKTSVSLAASIVYADLPYKPGVYLVYDYTNNKLGNLLYVGKAGVDKDGKINTHQLPKRLLATINPQDNYRNHPNMPKSQDVTRNVAWPIMMEVDKIESIKIFCFYSKISNYKVDQKNNPLNIEKQIRKIVAAKPKWARK